jgi:hypothetical protein
VRVLARHRVTIRDSRRRRAAGSGRVRAVRIARSAHDARGDRPGIAGRRSGGAALSFVIGCVQCVDLPTRQTFMLDLTGRAELRRGTSLFATVTGLAKIAGPGVAGIVIAATGETAVFFLNAASFLAVIAVLARLSRQPRQAPSHADQALGHADQALGHADQAPAPPVRRRPRTRPSPPAASAGCSTCPARSGPPPSWHCSWAASGSSSR